MPFLLQAVIILGRSDTHKSIHMGQARSSVEAAIAKQEVYSTSIGAVKAVAH